MMRQKVVGGTAFLFLICVWVFLLIFAPILAIWSLNTLFGLGIGYSIKTWFAMMILTMAFGNTKFNFKAKVE